MLRRRSVRVLVLGGVSALLGATATLAPSSQAASTKPPAVKGGLTQAYQASLYVKPKPAVIPAVRMYMTGTSQDNVNKLNGMPSGGLGPAKPTSTTTITQTTNPFVGFASGGSASRASAIWTGKYSGQLDGKMTITWFWSTRNAAAQSGNLTANVYADAGTPSEKLIGSVLTGVTAADGAVHAYTAVVDVKGTVNATLRIVGTPRFIDAGNDLTTHYGSTSAPAFVDIPKGKTPPQKLPTNPTVRETNPLVVSATRIGRKAAEPTLGVTKAGNAFIAAGDFDGASPANPRTLVYGSYDGNKTWKNVTPLIAGQPVSPATLDPYVYVDPVTSRIFNDDLLVGCSYLTWSDDQGKTWTKGNPLACESPVDDHQTLVTGPPPPGITTSGYPRVVYYCVNKVANVSCARSLDGGMTFRVTGNPAYQGVEQPSDGSPNKGAATLCGGLHGHIVTDPKGRLFVPKGHCDQPWVAISENAGSTWKQVRVNTMIVASHQTSIVSDTAGNLYYTWIGADDLLPYMAVSKNAGKTWGPALLIAPPGVTAVNFPNLDATTPGHLVVSFPGTTGREATGARAWNYYVAVSTDALAARPTFHSTTANPVKDPIHRGPCLDRCAGMFDFVDLVAAPLTGELWAAAVDTCTSPGCIGAVGPTLSAAERAADAQGVVIRQLSGPGLKKK